MLAVWFQFTLVENKKRRKQMKGKIFVGIMVLGIVLLAGACSTTDSTSITNTFNNQVPPAPIKYLVTISAEDFTKETNILRQVEVKTGDVFIAALDSNATTGFSWTEQAAIADGNILKQTEHEYIAPRATNDTKPVAGMSGIEEWWFTAGQTGTTTVTMSYGRPWEGGEKDIRTFILTVIVKSGF
jgi:inhibitor of cysteine peptidase